MDRMTSAAATAPVKIRALAAAEGVTYWALYMRLRRHCPDGYTFDRGRVEKTGAPYWTPPKGVTDSRRPMDKAGLIEALKGPFPHAVFVEEDSEQA